jgi:hypothetical protein
VVNANTKPVCYADSTVLWDDLALAVGGSIISTDTQVHGHWWTAGGGAAVELNEGCNSPATVDKPFPFSDVLSDIIILSQKLATQAPDLVLSEEGSLGFIDGGSTNCYHVMTLTPCHQNPLVCLLLDRLSSPKAILYGIGNWNGPSTPYPSDGKVLVINVPVFDGDTFEITTNQPSQGANSGSPFTGVVIAPLGDVIDGSASVFEGSLYVKSYRWESTNGVEIYDTPPCDGYHFCIPDKTTALLTLTGNVLPTASISIAVASASDSVLSASSMPSDVPSMTSSSLPESAVVPQTATSDPGPFHTHTMYPDDPDHHHNWHEKDHD